MQGWDLYNRTYDAAARRAGETAETLGDMNALRMRRDAGSMIADGDLKGGANALIRNGDITEGLGVINQGQRTQATELTADRATEDRQREALLRGATGLIRLPEEQWMSVFTNQIAPELESVGLGHLVPGIVEGGITRPELEAVMASLGGEVESPYANDRAGPDGSVIRPDASGAYAPVYTAPVDPLDAQYRQAQIDAMRASVGQRNAAAERSRRPPAPRGGGRTGGGASAPATTARPGTRGLPPGFTIRSR